jgi:hypothetical protein
VTHVETREVQRRTGSYMSGEAQADTPRRGLVTAMMPKTPGAD